MSLQVSTLRRCAVLVCVIALVIATAALTAFSAQRASADTAPASGTPTTVSADPLPTVQVNGVVWSQVTVGNTVYATGDFSETWPAGTSQSTAALTPEANILAYTLSTGALLTSFSHTLNARGLTITKSPDGSTVYVGGDFTTVDGKAHNHIAAFSTSTGALLSTFAPSIGGEVKAIAATSSTVYVGGAFLNVDSVDRTRLAAVSASNGALTSWAPTADDGTGVSALVVTPDQSEVVVGGDFSSLNGTSATSIGAVTTAVPATVVPYQVNQYVHDCVNQSANCYVTPSSSIGSGITSLTTDGNLIYGSGYSYSAGNFEGTFGVDPDTGAISFLNDCHGDTYDVAPIGSVLYTVSHAHTCQWIGGFQNTSPTWTNHRALAFTISPSGTNTGPDDYGWNYSGVPDSSLLQWYPTLNYGTFTGQDQAAWSVTGNSDYIALGGEFPTVNGTAQHGLVRFAVTSIAPNKVGPTSGTGLNAKTVSLSPGTVRVTWGADWDQDNQTLTYNVYRDSGSKPVYTTTQASNFWTLPQMGWVDTGVAPGSTHTYWVQAVDPSGNKLSGKSATITVTSGTATTSPYVNDVTSDGASDLWRFDESSGTTAYDWAGFNDMTNEGTGVTDGVPGPLGDFATAASFNGTSAGTASTTQAIQGPNTFTLEGWFNTTSTTGGKIVGFGNAEAGSSSGSYDRQVYMDNAGNLIFGVYNNSAYTVQSPKAYNDGKWHSFDAVLSSSGLTLFVDGVPVGQNGGTTVGQSYSGYWVVGGDNLGGWPNRPTNDYFTGSIGDVAVYPSALSLAQVQQHYTDAGHTLTTQPAPTDAYGKAVYALTPALYWRLNDASGPSALDTSPYQNNGTYSGGVTYQVPSTVSSTHDAVTLDGSSGLVVSSQPATDPSVFSESLWFKTTTTNGGELIGFGNAQSGLSSSYDRFVYMLNGGQLEFGTYSGQMNTVVSPQSYNDGKWHQVIATLGSAGMALYVDGQQVGSNPNTQAQNYTGYWRIGGDTLWGGANSDYFAGTVDEAAVFGTQLSTSEVSSLYAASPGAAVPPTASIATPNCTDLTCSFDGTGSSAANGATVTGYSWNFGDGSDHASGATSMHTFAQPGTYQVTLVVTDSNGSTSQTTASVVAKAAPTAPTATVAAPNCTYLSCSFDGSGSAPTTPGATITGYSWDYGDGSAAGTGATPSHTYAAAGTYTVTLTVTDSNAETAHTTTSVTVTAPPGPPTAAFTPSCTALACSFDGTGSFDPSGTSIASYAWTYMSGQTGIGATPSFTFPTAGVYPVTLTVTDANGTDSVTHDVTVSPATNPTINPYVSDSFERTATASWGTSTSGAAWSPTGSGTSLSVANNTGVINMASPGSGPGVYLGSVSSTDTSTTVGFTTSAASTGNGVYFDVVGRRVSSNTDYRGRVIVGPSGSVQVALLMMNAGAQKSLSSSYTVPGLTYTPGTVIDVQLQVTGTSPTTVRMKAWAAGSAYPANWQVSATDSTAALQANGAVGLVSYLASNATASVASKVSSFVTGPTKGLPTAVATTTCSSGSCSADGDQSTDPSGTISSYTWSWGDGAVSSGADPSHSYTTSGTYTVTLTVTDPSGYTSVVTRQVTV